MSDIKLTKDYIQKDITQQAEFLKKYPEFDGRGLLIAILDTGVDLSFDGMQKTSTGLPKVMDSFDFTGAGNVNTSIVKKVDCNNTIVGLTGRLLKIPSNWINPSGKWHLGIKYVYEMCSGAALERIIKIRKELISDQNKDLEQFINKNNKEDFNAAIEYLKMAEDLSKESLVADCIVWFNGKKWQACIDTSFNGDLENAKILTNYNDEHENDTIMDSLSFCIKIHDNGNLLEIISAFDDHGCGVAQVATGYFPDEPARNGLAPGAQIVSMTVMDSRNGIKLNNYALKKAFEKCIEMKVDIINCSFGCSTKNFEKQITKMTEKHGIIIIYAAGNNGPVYSSVQRRCSSNPNIFMIGSVSARKKKQDKTTYTVSQYSARGPNSFGDHGVTFVAPGHATITYPDYYPEKNKLKFGTSLAAPNVAGSIACLISALKGNSIEYSPSIIKFALSKTARVPESGNELSYGHGIIQILDAFDFINSSEFSKLYQSCNQRIKISNEDKNGIFLKLNEKNEEFNKTYTVEILNKPDDEKIKLKFTKKAKQLLQCSNIENNSFKAELNTKSIKPGTITYAKICGIHSTNSFTTFYLPITVIKPEKVIKEQNYRIQNDIILTVKEPYRRFLVAPEKSCQCLIKITALQNDSLFVWIHHAVENLHVDQKTANWLEFNKSKKAQIHYIKVFGNKIHEISLFLISSNSTKAKFKLEIDFYGFRQKVPKLAEKKNNRFTILNNLKPLNAALSVEFNKISYKILPENVCHESVKHVYDSDSTDYLKLLYFFTITQETKCFFQINSKKDFPLFRAQVFTESKKFIHGFCRNLDEMVTLLPGKYSIIAYAFYSPLSEINNNNNIPLTEELPSITLSMNLPEPFVSEAYSKFSKNINSKYTMEKVIENGKHQIHFEKIPSNKLPKPMPSTVTLEGSLKVSNENLNMDIPIKHEYTLNKKKKVKKTKDSNIDNELPSLTESFKEISINPKNPKKKDSKNKLVAAKSTPNNPIPKNLNKIQNDLIQSCRHFIQISKSHEKEINQIEDAIASGHFGMALLNLNKFSTKNQTNSNFKVIDLAIITLLKHLNWNYLVEAHQNALLDRHRDHYRLL